MLEKVLSLLPPPSQQMDLAGADASIAGPEVESSCFQDHLAQLRKQWGIQIPEGLVKRPLSRPRLSGKGHLSMQDTAAFLGARDQLNTHRPYPMTSSMNLTPDHTGKTPPNLWLYWGGGDLPDKNYDRLIKLSQNLADQQQQYPNTIPKRVPVYIFSDQTNFHTTSKGQMMKEKLSRVQQQCPNLDIHLLSMDDIFPPKMDANHPLGEAIEKLWLLGEFEGMCMFNQSHKSDYLRYILGYLMRGTWCDFDALENPDQCEVLLTVLRGEWEERQPKCKYNMGLFVIPDTDETDVFFERLFPKLFETYESYADRKLAVNKMELGFQFEINHFDLMTYNGATPYQRTLQLTKIVPETICRELFGTELNIDSSSGGGDLSWVRPIGRLPGWLPEELIQKIFYAHLSYRLSTESAVDLRHYADVKDRLRPIWDATMKVLKDFGYIEVAFSTAQLDMSEILVHNTEANMSEPLAGLRQTTYNNLIAAQITEGIFFELAYEYIIRNEDMEGLDSIVHLSDEHRMTIQHLHPIEVRSTDGEHVYRHTCSLYPIRDHLANPHSCASLLSSRPYGVILTNELPHLFRMPTSRTDFHTIIEEIMRGLYLCPFPTEIGHRYFPALLNHLDRVLFTIHEQFGDETFESACRLIKEFREDVPNSPKTQGPAYTQKVDNWIKAQLNKFPRLKAIDKLDRFWEKVYGIRFYIV